MCFGLRDILIYHQVRKKELSSESPFSWKNDVLTAIFAIAATIYLLSTLFIFSPYV